MELALCRLGAKVAALREACCEQRMFASVPTPAVGVREVAEQVIGRQAGKQQRAVEQLGLTQQYFTSRVHKRSLKKVA